MVEVRELGVLDQVPVGADHVHIERTPAGRFMANGVSGGDRHAAFWTPESFATLVDATEAASAWAEEHGVATIYVCSGKMPSIALRPDA